MAASQDTEITLGMGRLLGLFFGLVVVCALFFGFGYTLGRGSTKQSGSLVGQVEPTTTTGSGTTKPGASASNVTVAAKSADCTTSGTDCSGTAASQNPPAEAAPGSNTSQTQTAAETVAPELRPQSGSGVGAGYMVQVAAVSKQEDADLLRSALQSKQYPVVVTNMPSDKLFHVQVGPFADMQDAEAIKTRLTNDGYTPILKK